MTQETMPNQRLNPADFPPPTQTRTPHPRPSTPPQNRLTDILKLIQPMMQPRSHRLRPLQLAIPPKHSLDKLSPRLRVQDLLATLAPDRPHHRHLAHAQDLRIVAPDVVGRAQEFLEHSSVPPALQRAETDVRLHTLGRQ
ncbi:MAG: hypothetical protein FRX48_09447 [Lasallia pustulata]|uniref:Uncharacterized protein n=1 Tax=Lasallia pustulata TaxID=136370 RepID=A0A5M8PCR2_9LECA|nr:MAG: hypothetical protein FRX48_09447 [Lasallia pustulata]